MESLVKENTHIFNEEGLIVLLIKNLSKPTPIIPSNKFEGFLIHQPLDTVTIYNTHKTMTTKSLFMSKVCETSKTILLTPDSQLITIYIPWDWLQNTLGGLRTALPFHETDIAVYLTQLMRLKGRFMELLVNYMEWEIALKRKKDSNVHVKYLRFLSCLLSLLNDIVKRDIYFEAFPPRYLLADSPPPRVVNPEKTDTFSRYISNPTSPTPKLEEVAQELGVHVSTLKRHFKSQYDCSFYQAHLVVKMHYALHLLLKGHNVNEISKMIGYSQPNKLISVFKKVFDTTPGKVKESGVDTKRIPPKYKKMFGIKFTGTSVSGAVVFFD